MLIPSPIETMRKRSSCRTYGDAPLDRATRDLLRAFLRGNTRGPFGNALRFVLVDLSEAERGELRSLGTYGVIRGAGLFVAGAVARGPRALEDYGFGMERNILYATALGLGTCWLGGTLNRAGFARKIGLAAGELLPAISPVGAPAARPSLVDRAFRFAARSGSRKPWEELFFADRPGDPLPQESAGALGRALASVRLAPSASNRQPWRVVREGASCHFFLQRTRGYDKVTGEVRLQEVDMGIALCHFALAAEELGIPGGWVQEPPPFDAGTMEHVATWADLLPSRGIAGRGAGSLGKGGSK